jgi:GT2 family glycosyltransferase
MPRVSVIIPTWNGRALLEVSLPSLAAQSFTDFETIVVDNGSTDDTLAWLAAQHPHVVVVGLPENRGFAAAVNEGLRAAQGEVIALLNNDTEVDADWLGALVSALDRHPGVGICASRILNYYDRTRIDSAGDKLGLFADQVGHGEPDGPAFAEPRLVLSACAAAAAYRRAVFDRIGPFDERFVSYLEDVDVGLRARLAGFDTLYVPDAVIYHMVSATSQRLSHTKLQLLLRNSLFLFFQYMPTRTVLTWGAFMMVWPFLHGIRVGAPLSVPAAALREFLRDLPAVRRRRRELRASRVIDDRSLLDMLSPPIGRRRYDVPVAEPAVAR